MRPAFRSPPFERALAACVALTIFAFVCGSSSVPEVDRFGNKARWAMLVVLLVVAAGAAWRAAPRRLPAGAVSAAWLSALALASTAWSVDPRLTFERAVAFVLVLLAAALVALACARRPERALGGVLWGAVLVAVAGLVLLAVDRHWALKRGSMEAPTRFRGLGVDANTASLLYGVALPLAVFFVMRARARTDRLAGVAAFLLLGGSIVGSGSRAPLIAGFGAALLVAALAPARRVVAAAAVAVCFAVAIGLVALPKPLSTNPPPKKPAFVQPTPRPGYANAELVFPLGDDVGRSLPGQGEKLATRSLTGSSGRLGAWKGALHQAWLRPVAGHGFGMESIVFDDRYAGFVGGVPESSYVGLLLELGIAGLVSFAVVFVLWLVRGGRSWPAAPSERRIALLGAGAGFSSGLVMAVVQSYFYSAGNIATLSFWLCGFLLVEVARA